MDLYLILDPFSTCSKNILPKRICKSLDHFFGPDLNLSAGDIHYISMYLVTINCSLTDSPSQMCPLALLSPRATMLAMTRAVSVTATNRYRFRLKMEEISAIYQ